MPSNVSKVWCRFVQSKHWQCLLSTGLALPLLLHRLVYLACSLALTAFYRHAPIADLFDRRYDGKDQVKSAIDVTISSELVSKSFGTAMAGICFVDFIVPELESDANSRAEM